MEKDPWQIAAARFCVAHKEFTYEELRNYLLGEPYNLPDQVVRIFFTENIQHTAGRQHSREFRNDGLWSAPIEMVSMIADHDELREARINAKEAKELAIIAIAVSVGAAVASIIMPILVAQFIPQTVRIDEEQLRSINFVTTPTSENRD